MHALATRDRSLLAPDLAGGAHTVRPGDDAAIKRRVARLFEDDRDLLSDSFAVTDREIEDGGKGCVVIHDWGARPGRSRGRCRESLVAA